MINRTKSTLKIIKLTPDTISISQTYWRIIFKSHRELQTTIARLLFWEEHAKDHKTSTGYW